MPAIAMPPSERPGPRHRHGPSPGRGAMAEAGVAALTIAALGVVFGDIGTSPLYALQAVFNIDGGVVKPTAVDVYGVISLVFWSITMIVSVKYVTFIMRADNHGEGGIMALTALLDGAKRISPRLKVTLVILGIIGASLFYGDGAITPAISVLSAVQGLEVVSPSLSSAVLPITVAVLVMLFAIQRFGTQLVGGLFGPVMAIWFGTLALIGVVELAQHPSIIRGLSPTYAVQFLTADPHVAFVALGAVVLAVTGAEALYADMGHFGPTPIRRAWFILVFPALTLDYLAQGSLLLRDPKAISNPFFILLPGWAQLPMVILATVATVIASQAVISGAFSVTRQAMQLGFLPRLTIRQTSEHEVGQVYVPVVNIVLLVTVVAIVVGFGSSNALSSAYGVAVTGTFILNTVLYLAVARLLWHKPKRLIALGGVVFLTIEITFFAANLSKVVKGGWLPLLIAAIVFTVLTTWRRGRRFVTANRVREEGPIRHFIDGLDRDDRSIVRVPGTAVFLNANPKTTPLALRANFKSNHVLHEHVIIICIDVARVPHIPRPRRLKADRLGNDHDGITGLIARFGFQDSPNIPDTLHLALEQGLLEGACDIANATYFLSNITIVAGRRRGMRMWRKKLFLFMAHNAANAATYFGLPDARTVTMGERIEF